jgi:hypothetical protein
MKQQLGGGDMRKELDLIARTRRFIRQSGKLLSDFETLMAEWQELIDEQATNTFKRISLRLKRKGAAGCLLQRVRRPSIVSLVGSTPP